MLHLWQPGLVVGDPAHSRGTETVLFNPGHSMILSSVFSGFWALKGEARSTGSYLKKVMKFSDK